MWGSTHSLILNYSNLQCFFFSLFLFQCCLASQKFVFYLLTFKKKIWLGTLLIELTKKQKICIMTEQSCLTKSFYNTLLNFAQVQILRSLGIPACGWLRIPKLAGHDCLAQFFTSLMHMNCSRELLSMLMSILVCSEASHCLLIKLILVEDARNLAPKRQGREENFQFVDLLLTQRVTLPPFLFTPSPLLLRMNLKTKQNKKTRQLRLFSLYSEGNILSNFSCKWIKQNVLFLYSLWWKRRQWRQCVLFNGATVH